MKAFGILALLTIVLTGIRIMMGSEADGVTALARRMFGLAMLVIAALVGTRGLGQQVYIALTAGDTGKGAVAGLSMALIAMIADRIIQGWARKKKAALGLE